MNEGTSSFSAIRILTIKRWTNGNALAFGKRGTYNPASREKGSAASTLQPGQPLLSRGHLPGSPGIPKQDPNAKAVQLECGLGSEANDPSLCIPKIFKEPY
jgi:hypothetical protein